MSGAALEIKNLRTALSAAEERAAASEADLAQARAVVSTFEAIITALKLEITLLRREKYGRSAERTAQLIDQLEFQLGELVPDIADIDAEAEQAAETKTKVLTLCRSKKTVSGASAARKGRCGGPKGLFLLRLKPHCEDG